MDGRGRLAEPLTRLGNPPARRGGASSFQRFRLTDRALPPVFGKIASRISRFMRFCGLRLDGVRVPRFTGITALALFLAASIGANDTMNAQTLPKVRMPNRDGFIIRFPDKTP